eukprot:CAMPEP_0197434938 /NCGR_PEP_ID=MMETSP1175-20131217/2590_1 /TAXON_ID=1003142 /ORGANISM="Triceratium dubium, Strain CCMP147" /LENGTH=334 /DNA_ID=CAMNT_0042963823 /DNA_START=61 /DNA_END=1065 /DNA_ORIENTATION=+
MKLFSKFALASVQGSGGLGFGCMGITAFYGESMKIEDAKKLLQQVYDGGCRHFDTAERYAQGKQHNEAVLGEFFKTVPRDSFSVATKFWPGDGVYDYDTVKAHLVASLKRLGLDYVDLYYAHRVMSLEGGLEFGKTMQKLKAEGLVKEVGLSEVSGPWLKKIHTEACPIDAVQMEWSLMSRSLEEEVIPICKEFNITVVAYAPLARQMLASKVEVAPNDFRATVPRYSAENVGKNKEVVGSVHDIAEKMGGTAAQVSLAWLFHRAKELGVTVVPIPGSTKEKNALGNLKSTQISISDEDEKVLESLAAKIAGDRAPEWYMNMSHETQKEKKQEL